MLLHNSARSITWLLGTSYMTGFKASKRILLKSRLLGVGDSLSGVVEVDEVYQNAGLKGRNNSGLINMLGRPPRRSGLRRRGRGTYQDDKVPIFALIQRGGGGLFAAARDVTEETVLGLAEPRIKPGSTVYTNKYASYRVLDNLYRHEAVNHSIGEYTRGEVHINTCEGEFSLFRPFMAVHRGVAKYNVPLYASLFQLHRQLRQMEAPSALKHALKTILFLLLLQKLQAGIRSSSPTTFVY